MIYCQIFILQKKNEFTSFCCPYIAEDLREYR